MTQTFFDTYPEFLETSTTSTQLTRLNRRHEALIQRNLEHIEGKVVLDLASHDGRWSFAALKSGARKVIGVEARQHLVDNAVKTFQRHGIAPDRYEFVCSDLFDIFQRDLAGVDTIFCFGIFYHIIRHVELLALMKKTGARAILIDTNVCKSDRAILELRREDTRVEGAANPDETNAGPWKITGLPSEEAVHLMLNHLGYRTETIDWKSILKPGDTGVGQYRDGLRITVKAVREESHMTGYTFPHAVAGESGTLVARDGQKDIMDLDMREVARHFKSSGLMLFRGFDLDIHRFKRFTEALCSNFISYAGGAAVRSVIDGDPTLMTVSEAKHSYPVPLHGEMYYIERKPRVLWFYCVKPADEAGETTVGDGAWIYERLSPSTRELFEKNRIKYVMIHPKGRWEQIFQTEDLEGVRAYCRDANWSMRVDESDGSIVTEHLSKAIWKSKYGGLPVYINNVNAITRWEWAGVPYRKVRLEDGSKLPDAVIEEIWKVEDQATLPIAWRPGDVVMVDNTRFMHGRRTFNDMTREIYVRMATELIA